MGKTIAEKVLSSHSGSDCRPGDIVIADVDFCMSQDGTSSMMMRELRSMGFVSPKTKRGMAMVIDHNSPCPSADVSVIHKAIRSFADSHSIPLHDVGEGVCHQVVLEQGKVLPGDLVIGADSHTCTYGALNACSTGLGSADVAAAAYTGKLWFKVPETMVLRVDGDFGLMIGAKDLILTIIGKLTADGATYKSLEFKGAAIDSMCMDGRMTVANMAVEMGAKFCPFEFDSTTAKWFSERGIHAEHGLSCDPDARVESEMDFCTDDIVPMVARPHSVDNVCPASELADVLVDQVFIGTCTNGRLGDLEAAARILKGRTVKRGMRLIIAPASRAILLDAIEAGIMHQLIKSGAVVVSPGCGPCVGTHAGVPSDDETVLSTANRNFKGRMGNNKGVNIFLSSPETAAATAIRGTITDPREVM
ncbi:MAG: 3-isopropylmalate dehydratase large subunit [Candidatus Thermoplasmatota archaeon]|nr:3-isopropylmalate dehydratase large subunit [Candidatus Thermoplasmatota archaeon]